MHVPVGRLTHDFMKMLTDCGAQVTKTKGHKIRLFALKKKKGSFHTKDMMKPMSRCPTPSKLKSTAPRSPSQVPPPASSSSPTPRHTQASASSLLQTTALTGFARSHPGRVPHRDTGREPEPHRLDGVGAQEGGHQREDHQQKGDT